MASRVGAQWLAVMLPGGLEGVADVDPYWIQWQSWRRPVPARFTAPKPVVTVSDVGLYARGQPPAVNSDRDGAPPA
jgi:hypothetical protein